MIICKTEIETFRCENFFIMILVTELKYKLVRFTYLIGVKSEKEPLTGTSPDK